MARERRIVEVKVQGIRGERLLVDALSARQRDFPDERSTPRLSADKPHRLQLGIDASGRRRRQSFRCRKLAMGRKPGAGTKRAIADRCGELVNELLVSSLQGCSTHPRQSGNCMEKAMPQRDGSPDAWRPQKQRLAETI